MAAPESKPRRVIEPSQMLDRPGLLAWILFRFFFTRRFLRDRDRQALEDYSRRYRVVYVSSHKHVYNALWLNHLLRSLGLPLAALVTGVVTLVFQPFWRIALYLLGRRPRAPLRERARAALARGQPLMVFLRKGRRSGRAGICPGSDAALRACLDAAGDGGPEVVLVPLALFWGQAPLRPDSGGSRRLQRILGTAEDPGALRSFWHLFVHFRGQRLRLGEPLHLDTFLAQRPDDDEGRRERRLRYELATRIERVRRTLQGPRRKGAVRIREEVLRGRALRETITAMAQDTGEPPERLRRQARKYLKEIAADPRPGTLNVFRGFLRHFVWYRIYDGLEVDPGQMERLRQAAARGPLLLLPTHRSHVDYLLLSWIVAEYDTAPPCIAAGANLSFFPIGTIFRRSGAFFIRRSFWKDRLYTVCLTDYLRKILAEGYNLEFFIEGTRSRTGKMYMPRIGLLKWVAEAAIAGRVRNVQVVPIAVGYEKVIEEGSISREAAGGKKKKEDLGGLLRAGRVLASRFGRLNLQVGQPYDLRDALAQFGATRDASPEAVNAGIVQLAYRVVHEISTLCPVTPTGLVSTALLLSGGTRVKHASVLELSRWITPWLRESGARLTRALVAPPAPDGAVAAAEDGSAVAAEAGTAATEGGTAAAPEDRSAAAEGGTAAAEGGTAAAEGGSAAAAERGVSPDPAAQGGDLREEALVQALRRLADGKTLRQEGPPESPIYVIEEERRFSLSYYRNGLINFLAAESIVARAVLVTEAEDAAGLGVAAVHRRAQFLSRLWKYEFVFEVGKAFDAIFDETLRRLQGWGVERSDSELWIIEAGRRDLELLSLLTQDYLEAYRIAVISLAELLEGPVGRKNLVQRMREDAATALERRELRRRESCSRITFDNAVSALMDLEVLEQTVGSTRHGTPIALRKGYHTGTGLTALLDRLNRLWLQDAPSAQFDPAENTEAAPGA
jgi:glycerol-3-phosphate O-acyltransferase